MMGSGGDGMGGLLVAILAAMAGMVGIGTAIGVGAGFLIARLAGLQKRARVAAIAVSTLFGLLAGNAWVAATFMESSWNPPPELHMALVPGFAAPFVVVIVDPARGVPLIWSGGKLPMTVARASISLPASGIVRVRSLGEAEGRGDLVPVYSDGATSSSLAGGPAPPGLGGTHYLVLERRQSGDVPAGPSVDLPAGDALLAYIKSRP